MPTSNPGRTTANKPTRAGYAWVEDRRVKKGGYWRKLPKGGAVSAIGQVPKVGNRFLKNTALVLGGAVAGGAVGAFAVKWSSDGAVNRRIEEAKQEANEKAKREIRKIESKLGRERSATKTLREANKKLVDVSERTLGNFQRQTQERFVKRVSEIEARANQKVSEVEGRVREITERVNREAMQRIAEARAAASQAAQDEIQRALEPKANRPGVLIDDEKQGIALGASVRQGLNLGFDPVSRENLDRRVREATNRLSGRHLSDGMQALSLQFRDKAGKIISKTNQTADAGWLEMKKLLASQNLKEGALSDEVNVFRQRGLQEYRKALDTLHKQAEQNGKYTEEMITEFDRKSKKIYRKMRLDIQNYSKYVQTNMRTQWDSVSEAYRSAYQSVLVQV